MDFDIAIFYIDEIAEQMVLDLANELQQTDIKLKLESRENTPFATWEWAIPAAIIAYIAKPYIDGLLKEAAKEHYPIFKKALSGFAERVSKLKLRNIVSSHAPNKLQPDSRVSSTFAVWSTSQDGRVIKFLFYAEKDASFYEDCIEKALTSLIDHIQDYPNDSISHQSSTLPRTPREIYMLFEESTKNWVVVDSDTRTSSRE